MRLLQTITSVVRRIVKSLYLQFLFCTGLLKWARSQVARRGAVVLTLHRVLPDEQYDSQRLEPGMVVRASTFQHLLEYLSRACNPVLPQQAISSSAQSSRRPQVVMTFDDGWKDNLETALPLSRKYGVPFTVFICPYKVDRQDGFWTTTVNNLWWTAQDAGKLNLLHTLCAGRTNGTAHSLIESLKHADPAERQGLIVRLQTALAPYVRRAFANRDRLLTWPDVKRMAKAGIVFGSHTNTHPILTDISDGDATRELTESKGVIEANLNTCQWFAYPNGDWSQSVRDLAERAGYQAAFANAPGIWKASNDRFSIPRVNLWEGSMAGLSGRFSRAALEYAIFWKAYRASGN